jgi:hypothetical protein
MSRIKDRLLGEVRKQSMSPFHRAYATAKRAGRTHFRWDGTTYDLDTFEATFRNRCTALLNSISDAAHKARKSPDDHRTRLFELAAELVMVMRLRVSAGDLSRDDFSTRTQGLINILQAALEPSRRA